MEVGSQGFFLAHKQETVVHCAWLSLNYSADWKESIKLPPVHHFFGDETWKTIARD
jgi:hypothetical protein